MHVWQRFGLENVAAARDGQPVAHVRAGIVLREGHQIVAGRRLRRRMQSRARHELHELRFADQDDLEKLPSVDCQVRENAELLEHLQTQVLRFVHDQHRAPRAATDRQLPVEGVEDHRGGHLDPVGHPELVTDDGNELRGGRHGIEDQRDVDALGQPGQEHATCRRLADTALPGEEDDAGVRLHAVEQIRERLLVVRARIDESKIGRVRERTLAKTEML